MSWTGKHPIKTQVSEYLTQALSFMSCAIFSQTSFRETGSLVPSTTITPVEGLNLDAPIQFDLVSPVEGGLSLTPLIGPPKLVLCSCCGVSFCHTFCPVFSLLPVSLCFFRSLPSDLHYSSFIFYACKFVPPHNY